MNPFPGLRPFEADEDHLFFGREAHVDELLRRLRAHRFLAIVGTSGCGKSSLVRCGLVPSLHGGQMIKAGSSWRIAVMRPGGHPYRQLATALAEPGVLDTQANALASSGAVVVEAALRRGSRGLIDAVTQARLPAADNVLVIVDQFEELFRFQRGQPGADAHGEAVAFVRLLLEASEQAEVPIYVVLTMRSDFIGECMEYPGLPEALNAGQYLVPRMTRDEMRLAITGPVAVAGADIAPRLVQRLLNEVGVEQDQLPVLQHALMRTWDRWATRAEPRGPIDLEDYEAVGGMREALSRHAEEAFAEAGPGRGQEVAEHVFRALTDVVADSRGGRRPCSMEELSAVTGAGRSDIARVVDAFRRPGRSFLMPPADVPLDPTTIVDLSHESLMRGWTRLRGWADDERVSATIYLRLSRAAQWHQDGTAGLWRDPELGLGLKWRAQNRPTAAWASRYDTSFALAMGFLDESERQRDREADERRQERRRQWRRLQWVAAALATLLVVSVAAAVVATRQSRRAREESARAEENLRLAREAVDQSFSLAERDPVLSGTDVPEVVRLRRQLLEQGQRFYSEFAKQAQQGTAQSEQIQRDVAFARLRLGHRERDAGAFDAAATHYRVAIEALSTLARDYPTVGEYRRGLVDAYNDLGQALSGLGGRDQDAIGAYNAALDIRAAEAGRDGVDPDYQLALGRTRMNRAILFSEQVEQPGASVAAAEADLREAIRLFEPIAGAQAAQNLGRAYNNLGSLAASEDGRQRQARDLYARAVQVHERLAANDPGNREYIRELVTFYNNLSDLHRQLGETAEATRRNAQALERIDKLARPAPSVGILQADSYNLLGRISEARSLAESLRHYRRSLDAFVALGRDEDTRRNPDYHLRFGDLIENVAGVAGARPTVAGSGRLLSDVLSAYVALSEQAAAAGSAVEARSARQTLDRIRSVLGGGGAAVVNDAVRRLGAALAAREAANR